MRVTRIVWGSKELSLLSCRRGRSFGQWAGLQVDYPTIAAEQNSLGNFLAHFSEASGRHGSYPRVQAMRAKVQRSGEKPLKPRGSQARRIQILETLTKLEQRSYVLGH